MEKRHRQRCRHPALIIALAVTSYVAPASATTFVYDQLSSSVPGLLIQSSMTIAGSGTLADLPIVNSLSNPIDFGSLLSFSLTVTPDPNHYSLVDFAPQGINGFPLWHISPTEIDFIDAFDMSDFEINITLGTINFNEDGPGPLCTQTGSCMATGRWVAAPVPEPSSMLLMFTSLLCLLGVAAIRSVLGIVPEQCPGRQPAQALASPSRRRCWKRAKLPAV